MSRILVIDDQEHIRRIIKQLVAIDGHEVETAENGKVGLKMIRNQQYDLVITDVVMPEEDGLGVLMVLKEQFPHIRIIVMTGGGARVDISNTLAAARCMGADRVMAKPLDFTLLQNAVKEVLAIGNL